MKTTLEASVENFTLGLVEVNDDNSSFNKPSNVSGSAGVNPLSSNIFPNDPNEDAGNGNEKEMGSIYGNESRATTSFLLSYVESSTELKTTKDKIEQQRQQLSPDNGMNESATQQIGSQQQNIGNDAGGTGQISTPHTPGTPASNDLAEISRSGIVNCSSPDFSTVSSNPCGGDNIGSGNNLSYASLTPIRTSTQVVQNTGEDGIRGNGSYVTYVEGSEHHSNVFGSSSNSSGNEEAIFPIYTVSESGQLYHSGAGGSQYYATTSSSQHVTNYTNQQPSNDGYNNLQQVNNNSNDTPNANLVGQPVAHTTRISPATVQWLLENYETAEGVSLPRSTLYYHYIKHTHEANLDPVNAASFGKLIRSVFLGLRTRRLGTRGNSKYHYYGIRLKPSSPLNGLDEKSIDELMIRQYSSQNKRSSSSTINNLEHSNATFSSRSACQIGTPLSSGGFKKQRLSKSEHVENVNGLGLVNEVPCIKRYLGDASQVINSLPEMDVNSPLIDGLVPEDLSVFHSLYREHCAQLLGDMMNFQFSEFQRRWRIFFRTEKSPVYASEQQRYETLLPKYKLYSLCKLRHVQDYVRRTDYQLYQNLATILLPDVLRPIPSAMTQTIRSFAKMVESCMASAMQGIPEEMILMKLNILNAFGQTLRRNTSLNHLAQAARAVLQNESQVNQMLSDLNRVDFGNVEEQASWVCGCKSDIVPDIESDFKAALAQHQSLEEWASWLESVVDRVLRPHENSSKYTVVARYFLLKWSFYSSLVIRDLTLRSAASFGSFHLLRLLYDEYMYYLVENRVAKAVNSLPLAVIGKELLEPLHLERLGGHDDDSESIDTMSSSQKDLQMHSYPNSENDLHFHNDKSNSPKSSISSNGQGFSNRCSSSSMSNESCVNPMLIPICEEIADVKPSTSRRDIKGKYRTN